MTSSVSKRGSPIRFDAVKFEKKLRMIARFVERLTRLGSVGIFGIKC